MPNLVKKLSAEELLATVLVEAFNVNNCTRGIMGTNFTTDGHRITMTFAGDMHQGKCQGYLKNLRDRINGAVYQDSDGIQGPFNIDSFPFNANHGTIFEDETIGKFKYEVPITGKVLFNLQAHLMHSMVKPTEAEMTKPIKVTSAGVQLTKVKPRTVIKTYPFDSNKYVICSSFESKELAEEFKRKFCAEMVSLQYDLSRFVEVKVEVKGNNTYNNVYIKKDITYDVDFIQKCVQYNAGKISYSFDEDSGIDNTDATILMEMSTQFIYHTTGIVIDSYHLTPYSGSNEKSILLPTIAIKDEAGKKKDLRFLNAAEVQAINYAFGFPVVNNLAACISDERIISEQDKETYGIHGVDFFNKDICQCVFDTLFENALVTQIGKNEYGLEVQPSPHITMLRAKVDEFYAQEAQLQAQAAQQAQEAQQAQAAQLQEAQLQAQAAQMRQETLSNIQEAQSRAAELLAYANAAQSRSESNQLRAEAAQSQARATISYVEAAQLKVEANGLYSRAAHLRVEAVKSRAKAAQYYEEASQLHAEIVQSPVEVDKFHTEVAHFRTEATRLYSEAAKLNEKIENNQNKKGKVSRSTCKPGDQLSLRSVASSSSDDTTDHPPNATCSSSSNNFGNSNNGTRPGNGGTQTEGYIPPPPPPPEDQQDPPVLQDQPVITAKSHLFSHRPLAQKNSNSIGYSSVPDSGHNSLKRGTTPPSQSTSTYSNTAPSVDPAKKYQPKHKSLLSRVRSFFYIAKKGKSPEDSFQHSISEVSATSIVSGASIASADYGVGGMTQGKNNVPPSELSNLRVERGGQIIGVVEPMGRDQAC